jgi:carboxyl-terminal processing protease
VWRNDDQSWDYMLDPKRKIGYIRLTQFSEHTAEDFKAALESLVKQHAKGVILDLRFNPGGLLDAAVAVSDMFLPAGKRIVSTKGRTVPEEVRMSTDQDIMLTEPLVVLVNQGSASAAEIVSGALLDNQRAQLVGVRTFGKGSVQQVHALGMEAGSLNPGQPQSALKLTNAYYYLPNGRNIHRRPNKDTWGVDPNDGFYVPMDTDEIRKMITVRREGDVIHRKEKGHDNLDITPDWIQQQMADKQLAAGFKAMVGKLDTGNWPVVGLNDVQAHELAARRESLENQREFLQDKLTEIQAQIDKLDKPVTLPGTAQKVQGAVQTAPATTKPAK